MRRSVLVLAVVAVTMISGAANAITFTPSDHDIFDLDHYYYYTWGINYTIPAGQQITEATLTFKKINNWKLETNANWLYMHLLDTVPSGLNAYYDNQGNGDAFSGQGVLIDTYTDNSTATTTLTYKFSNLGLLPTLTSYISNNGNFGFGFDPDCHYYNDGICFEIITGSTPQVPPVPEPMTVAMSLMGLSSIAGLRRLRSKG